jgi:dienelactone hydrolase
MPLLSLGFGSLLFADGPGDNVPEKVRPIPRKGIALSKNDRAELQAGVDQLGKEIDDLRTALAKQPDLRALLPDVQVFREAVRSAVTYNEFFDPKEVKAAKGLLRQGLERARQLRQGKAPWDTAAGLVVRGYVSKIDGSVQPYGLVVPASYRPPTPHRFRLDIWFHGRQEELSEVNFLTARQSSPGEFAPSNAFVLHPYGRFCNANRFAGEIDLFEALADVRKHYPIDGDRLVVRGFSMGGAACWQFAVHHPGLWAAAAPGAGFSETADFLKVFQKEKLQPAWYEQKLWHLNDATDYAINLFNCPTVAYSGERDAQKQAADRMAQALRDENIEIVHVIGKGARHHYTPEARAEINRRIDRLAAVGRDPVPREIHFTTWTLRYNRCRWVQVDGLERHWDRARVDAVLTSSTRPGPSLQTKNVTALTLTIPSGRCPLDLRRRPMVWIDGEMLRAPQPLSDRSWVAHFRKVDGKWKVVDSENDGTLRKRHGLQGPIDDAFLDSFLMVRPTGKPLNDRVGKWAAGEQRHAVEHWRRQFRGEARVKDDRDVTDADIAAHNLVLWGDPISNRVLAKIAAKLPIRWDAAGVRVGDKTYGSDKHVAVMIYPNPLNPKRYVVFNSGFTFREYDYLNNARQTPKLPDYAVIDVSVPASSRSPGGVAAAGFFDERWRLEKDSRKEGRN